MAESYPFGQKTLWEKEKLLVTSNFSFSHSIFKRLVSQGRQTASLCGNGLKSKGILSHDEITDTAIGIILPLHFAPLVFLLQTHCSTPAFSSFPAIPAMNYLFSKLF